MLNLLNILTLYRYAYKYTALVPSLFSECTERSMRSCLNLPKRMILRNSKDAKFSSLPFTSCVTKAGEPMWMFKTMLLPFNL